MAESTIITGQFVRISQVPASLGERILARIIDYFLLFIYILATSYILGKLNIHAFPEVRFSCCSCSSICLYYVTRYFAKFLTKDRVPERNL